MTLIPSACKAQRTTTAKHNPRLMSRYRLRRLTVERLEQRQLFAADGFAYQEWLDHPAENFLVNVERTSLENWHRAASGHGQRSVHNIDKVWSNEFNQAPPLTNRLPWPQYARPDHESGKFAHETMHALRQMESWNRDRFSSAVEKKYTNEDSLDLLIADGEASEVDEAWNHSVTNPINDLDAFESHDFFLDDPRDFQPNAFDSPRLILLLPVIALDRPAARPPNTSFINFLGNNLSDPNNGGQRASPSRNGIQAKTSSNVSPDHNPTPLANPTGPRSHVVNPLDHDTITSTSRSHSSRESLSQTDHPGDARQSSSHAFKLSDANEHERVQDPLSQLLGPLDRNNNTNRELANLDSIFSELAGDRATAEMMLGEKSSSIFARSRSIHHAQSKDASQTLQDGLVVIQPGSDLLLPFTLAGDPSRSRIAWTQRVALGELPAMESIGVVLASSPILASSASSESESNQADSKLNAAQRTALASVISAVALTWYKRRKPKSDMMNRTHATDSVS